MRVLGCGFLTFEVFVDGLFRFRVLGLGYWACCFRFSVGVFSEIGFKEFRICLD